MNVFKYLIVFLLMVSNIALHAKLVGPEDIPLDSRSKDLVQAQFINDSVVNMSDQNITVQVQFHKIINTAGLTLKKEDLKKYAANKQVNKTITYVLAPKKSLKMYEAFIKANPLNDKSYWVPSIFEIATQIQEPISNAVMEKQLTVTFVVGGSDMVDEVIESKKYRVSIINNQLQVETENKLKP